MRARWERFFFTEEPVYAAVAYRIFLSLWTIAFFLPKLPHAKELYAREVLREAHPAWRALGDPIPPLWLVQLALGALLLLLLVFAFEPSGKGRRAVHVAVLVLLTWIMALDMTVPRAYGNLALLQWWLLLVAPHEHLREPSGTIRTAPRWGTRLLMLQFCSVYGFAVLAKLMDGKGWTDGSALYYSLRSPRFGQYLLSSWAAPSRSLCVVLGWGTLVAEALIFAGLWSSRARWLGALACVGLHLGIALSMRVSFLFHALMIGHLLLFIPPQRWPRLHPRLA